MPFLGCVPDFLVFTIAGWPRGKNDLFITLDFVLKTSHGGWIFCLFLSLGTILFPEPFFSDIL